MNILLRPWKQADAEPLIQLASNKKIWINLRDYFPHPYTAKDAKAWIDFNAALVPPLHFVIEADGQFAGGIGMLPKHDVYRNNMEIGYWLGEPYWGKGIATKAIALLCDVIAKEYPHINRIYAEVFENNNASMRALEKNGFELECIRKKAVIKNNVLLDDYVWVKFRSSTS
jgi:[ribosomal protein S5]-alanine N-acetyltransferase